MVCDSVFKCAGVDVGAELPAYAWPGGYPLVYILKDGATLCPECVNGANGSDARVQDDAQWNVVAVDVYWEGPVMACDHCGASLESAYGDPDADD